jgi:hypothetical protein
MLSVIIPYYKINFFKETLQSLALQTDKRFKVYIGDDESPESPSNLIEKYKNHINIVYKKFDENLGAISLTKQWERCIALSAIEEWIMILGDDDVLGDNVVEEFYKNKILADENDINVIRFATQKINQLGQITSSIFLHPKIEKSTDFLIRKYKYQTRSSLSEYVFKNDITKNLSKVAFPLAWNSDVALVLEHSNFKNVLSLNNGIVSIRISDKSISGSDLFDQQKNNANYQFVNYIFTNLNEFNNKQQAFLISKFENIFLYNKRRILFGLRIIFHHLYNFKIKSLVVFVVKIVKVYSIPIN